MPQLFTSPLSWRHQGRVLERSPHQGQFGSFVVGDPCIVWDETLGTRGGWRMFLFADPPGHGQAISYNMHPISAGDWELAGPLSFTNPEAILGGPEGYTHKPFVVMDPQRPNQAACVNGRYYLLTVSFPRDHKVVQRAWSTQLSGPWTIEPEVLISPEDESAFDGKHIDAISGYYFADREEFVYFYMGYPQHAQDRRISPFGSAQGVATQRVGEARATRRGVILAPSEREGHWSSGYVGGLQLLPGSSIGSPHRWIGLLNASPTAPDPADTAISREEPPPSLGGFAYCDEEWPVQGWQWADEPIEWIADIPAEAVAEGEGVNQWRHHLLVLPDGQLALFYNSGSYGQEQLYLKLAR